MTDRNLKIDINSCSLSPINEDTNKKTNKPFKVLYWLLFKDAQTHSQCLLIPEPNLLFFLFLMLKY